MSKDDILTLRGTIIEILPNATFRVKLENDHKITAYTAGSMRKNRIKILLHDEVDVEISTYDLTKGRVVHRYKKVS